MAAICVYCSSADGIDDSYVLLAEKVGTRLGAGGHSLVWGGGRVSMMGIVARAARSAGAWTLGVTHRRLLVAEVADVEADELVIAESLRERKAKMDEAADAFLVLPGGLGTLEELFEVWTAGSLGAHSKPVVILDPFGHYSVLWSYLESLRDKAFIAQAALDYLHRTTEVDAAFAIMEG
jgi:uncharacterized protein (TIGR00730 family)